MPIHISGYLYEWKAAIEFLKLYIIPEHNQADKKKKCRDAKFGKCDKGSEDFGNI